MPDRGPFGPSKQASSILEQIYMTTRNFLNFLKLWGCLANAASLSAQTNSSTTASTADQDWQAIQTLVAPPVDGVQPRTVDLGPSLQTAASQFKNAADKAKAFREKYTADAKVSEAKEIEAQSLLRLALAGDNSQTARAATLVQEVRADAHLSAKARMEVVTLSEILRLKPLMKDPASLIAAREESARGLVAEFPLEAGGYEALFRVAENNPDETKAVALAQEVLSLPSPVPLKQAARVFIDRHALLGQSLQKIAESALGAGNIISATSGKGIVLYSWATWSPGRIAFAKRLASVAPPGVALIGVNLDEDVAAARARAEVERLPGDQIYDKAGLDGQLAQNLKLTPSLPVYIANSKGEIRDVSAERGDLAVKLASALR